MPFALLLALAAVAGATLLTYLYDREALLWSRLCAGVCVGFSALGLAGFVLASLVGMGPASLGLAGLLLGSPLLLLLKGAWRGRASADVREALRVVRRAVERPREGRAGTLVFYILAAAVSWLVFAGAMYRNEGGVFTGLDTNLGDLPFHVSLVTGFAYGDNFPPEHTEFAGVKLTYPFVVDFVTAMFVRAGAGLEGAFFWQNLLMMLAFVGLLHRWALRLTGDRAAAVIAALLVLLSGGFGWWAFLGEAAEGGRGVIAQLTDLPRDYTRHQPLGYSWANFVTALLVPQRGILLGAGLAMVVWTLWWEATVGAEGRGPGAVEKEGTGHGGEPGGAGGGRRAGKAKKTRGSKSGEAREHARREGREAERWRARLTGKQTRADDQVPAPGPRPPAPLTKMIAAGLIAGLLPLVHAHSFVVMMAMGACLALSQAVLVLSGGRHGGRGEAADRPETAGPSRAEQGRAGLAAPLLPWAAFFAAASLVAVPQMLWATSGAAVSAGRFFGWEFGWDHGAENVLWFWLKNTGVFIPLLAVALLWRGGGAPVPARLLFFYLPFALCFVVPNVYKLSPWVWDNIKVLIYWWVASAPLVALVVARLWRAGAWGRAAALALVVAQTAAGGLDVWRAASGAVAHRTFDADGVRFAEMIKRETSPRALILHAPTYNDPVYLTGRRTFLGYTGHLWSHGLDYAAREAELKRVYAGGPDAARLLERNGIDYVVVGPLERAELGRSGVALNEGFFQRFRKVGEAGEYRLYKTRP